MTGRSGIITCGQMAPLGTLFSRELMVSCSSQTFVSYRKLNFPFILTPKPDENYRKTPLTFRFSAPSQVRSSFTHCHEIGQGIIFGTVRDNACQIQHEIDILFEKLRRQYTCIGFFTNLFSINPLNRNPLNLSNHKKGKIIP